MEKWITIDFGTSTVKAAYLDDGEPKALKLGRDRDTIPSVFHLSNKTGELSIGEKAEERGEKDPDGDIPFLKRNLKKTLRWWRRRIGSWWSKISGDARSDGDLQREFLAKLFMDIRERAGERIPVFQGKPPTAVCLTVTSCYDPDEKNILHAAAKQAGFEEVTDLEEPLAAARMWKEAADVRHNHAVVLDCGGGTTDWAYVSRESGGNFQIPSKFEPGGVKFGGSNVDKELYRRVQAELKCKGKSRANRRNLMREVRTWKEDYCNDYALNCEFRGTRIALTPSDIQSVIDSEFIQPVFEELKPFVEKLKEKIGEPELPVLLVGGGHNLKGLKEAVKEQLGCEPFLSEHEITGPALGAALWVEEKYSQKKTEKEISEETEVTPEEDQRRRLEVANHFREIATLIGDRQNEEIELTSGRRVVPGLIRMIDLAAALEQRANRLEKGGLRLAVVGSRSRGKSTLINALLGEDLLPTDIAATTAIITLIVEGKKKEVTLVEKSDEKRIITRQEFLKNYVLDVDGKVPQEFVNIDHALLEVDNSPLCKVNLQLVDTLGLHGGSEAEAITLRYLDQVDAVLLVLDDQKPFETEDDNLIDKVRREGDSALGHVFFVINDRGLNDAKKKRAIEYARSKLPELGEAFERQVFIIDAQSALDNRLAGENDNSTTMQATNLPAFEREIVRFLKRPERVNAILGAAVRYVLNPAVAAARSRMEDSEKLLKKSEVEMDNAVRDFNLKLPQLHEKVASIQKNFDNFAKEVADIIADKVVSRVMELVDESSPQWKNLGIGGSTNDYMSDVEDHQRAALAHKIITNIAYYFRMNTYGPLREGVKSQLVTMSKPLRGEVTNFVKELGRPKAPWLMANFDKLLSNCETRVHRIISDTVQFPTDEVSELIKDEVETRGVGRVVFGVLSMGLTELISKETRAGGRRESVKNEYRKELEKRLKARKSAQVSEIRDAIVEVFKDPSEKLQKDLIAEMERRQRILEDIRETTRSGVEANTTRLRRLETINTCLDEAFDAINQMLIPQEQ